LAHDSDFIWVPKEMASFHLNYLVSKEEEKRVNAWLATCILFFNSFL